MSGGDTIFALSSGALPAAIGIVRISGRRAADALEAVAGRLPAPRRATRAWLRDPASGERIDHALVLWFAGPNTATGEDLAECHIHGGRAVAAALLGALGCIPGLRAAEPGEFTRRAFANGVLDLAEAEGLADLLAAETEGQRRAALLVAGGALSRRIERWSADLLEAAAMTEALLDFADEDDVGGDEAPLRQRLDRLGGEIAAMLDQPPAERLRDGIRVVLAGPPNAGKSTLLNRLVGREAAIVSDVAGTTRDVIEVPVVLGGRPFLFSDTAGLRESTDGIEAIGIARAEAAIISADILLWLDAATPPPVTGAVMRVHARSDLDDGAGTGLAVSALTGAGMDMLHAALIAQADSLLPREGEVSLNRRQRDALHHCLGAVQQAIADPDAILVAEALRAARQALDTLLGRIGVEDMLDALFGRFCIGK